VSVLARDYVGSPAQQAATRLRGLGLAVRVGYVSSGGAAGSVAGVRPTGRVPVGDTVTLSVVRPAPSATASPADQDDGGTSDEAPGEGSGKGSGKGKGHDKGKGGKGGDD
jgi:hypothetical protein